MKFYSLDNILSHNARYNIIIGERSNGKTFACLKKALEEYVLRGGQTAIVRRWADDFTGKRGSTMFDALVSKGIVEKLTKGQWTGVYYYSSRWYLCKWDDDLKKRIVDETPFAYGFAISTMEHDKSTSYPNITIVIFDEFLSRGMYLPDEFVLFMNVLSTIIRERNNVIIFMLGNTVNKYCPYFDEMGIKHISEMEKGDIDVYKYGDSGLIVAVEMCGDKERKKNTKPSDVYFAFDNPKLNMITGGDWEIGVYPHHPKVLNPKMEIDILYTFFIKFDTSLLQCEVQSNEHGDYFIYIHEKTTPLRRENIDLIYTPESDPRYNYRKNILKPITEVEKKIKLLFSMEKIFYQDNNVGEVIRNYLMWCKSN